MENKSNKLMELCKPLVEYLYKNGTPHSTIIVTQRDAELLSGEVACVFELRDKDLRGLPQDGEGV